MPVHPMPSPLPGTFYRRPSPEMLPFKEVGDLVAQGDTIGLIEVMKTFVLVTAEQSGTITVFHVENDEAIMAGQPLVDIET